MQYMPLLESVMYLLPPPLANVRDLQMLMHLNKG